MVYILFFICLIGGGLRLGVKPSINYLRFIMIFLALIIGLRNNEVGVDTLGYVEDFAKYKTIGFDALPRLLSDSKEPLFVLGSWFVSAFFDSSVAFTLFWAAFPCMALYKLYKEEVAEARGQMIAILCLFALGLFAFFLAGVRQTAAISMVLFAYLHLKNFDYKFSFSTLKNRNFLLFLLYMLLAYNLHNSSVLFLIVLFVMKMRIRWWYLPAVIGLFFIGSTVKVGFLVEMSALIFDDRFANYGTVYESSQSMNAFIMQFILFLICYFQREELISKDYHNNYLFNIMVVGLFFQSMSGMIYEMARVAFYFSIFGSVLVPKAMAEYSNRKDAILYSMFSLAIIVYLFFLSGSNLPKYYSVLF